MNPSPQPIDPLSILHDHPEECAARDLDAAAARSAVAVIWHRPRRALRA